MRYQRSLPFWALNQVRLFSRAYDHWARSFQLSLCRQLILAARKAVRRACYVLYVIYRYVSVNDSRVMTNWQQAAGTAMHDDRDCWLRSAKLIVWCSQHVVHHKHIGKRA